MNKNHKLSYAALLTALSFIIPLTLPSISIPPASYTLAAHVPLMLALFIDKDVAISVVFGSSLAFFLRFPPVVALRALSHISFTLYASYKLKKRDIDIYNNLDMLNFNIKIALIHAIFESLIVLFFYTVTPFTNGNLFYFVFIFIGVGGFIHSLVDFRIAQFIIRKMNIQA